MLWRSWKPWARTKKTIASQLKNRLKKYSPEVEQAARARNEGKDSQRQELTKQLVREMYETLGIREGVKADAEKREAVIDLVTGAINQKADSLLAGDKDRTVYSDLTDALETGKWKDVQDEIDRLRTAGKDDDSIKPKITAAVKERIPHRQLQRPSGRERLQNQPAPAGTGRRFLGGGCDDRCRGRLRREAAAGAGRHWTLPQGQSPPQAENGLGACGYPAEKEQMDIVKEKRTMKNQVCTIIGIVGGAIATAFGGWDTALAALVTFMAIDYITGLMVAGIFHTSPKTESGALESLAGWKGLCRKGVTLLVCWWPASWTR